MEQLLEGFVLLFQWQNLIFLVAGLILGFVVGALPGFESSNAAALLLPLTLGLTPEGSVIMMAAVYAGSQFGGSVPAILFNVPGSAGSAATAADGYPMALQGKGGLAIGIARGASTLGGVISSIVVLLLIAPLAALTLLFGSPETFLLVLLGISMVGSVFGSDLKKGIISGLLGLAIASMSLSPHTGEARLTFGFVELYGEVPFVPILVGVFGITEMMYLIRRRSIMAEGAVQQVGKSRTGSVRTILRDAGQGVMVAIKQPVNLLRSSFLGMVFGVIPGMGTTVANFAAYSQAKKYSKTPEKFGSGHTEGIVASETADNASVNGTMVPTLAVGIPGSATAAIMLAALYLHGITPGPRLMETHGTMVYAILGSLLVVSILTLPLGTALATPLIALVKTPIQYMVPSVLVLCLVSTLAVRGNTFDLALAAVLGLVGYAMKRAGYPVVPMVLGVILGPIAENALIRSMSLGGGSLSVFVSSPTGIVILIGLVALLSIQVVNAILRNPDRRMMKNNVKTLNAPDTDEPRGKG